MNGKVGTKSAQDKSGGHAAKSLSGFQRSKNRGTHADILALQRAAGNSAVGELIRARDDQRGADLADVQIHTGPGADARTHAQGAAAYATGRDVYLGSGVDPTTDLGQRVLAHELTHIVQQERGRAGMPLASPANLEGEASAVSGVGFAGAWSGAAAAAPGSVQKVTEAELEREWRRLHPRMATVPNTAKQGGLATVDEGADRAEREAYAAWREKRIQQAEAAPAGTRDADLDQQLDRDVLEIKEQLDSFFYTNDDKIAGILSYWALEPFQSGRVRDLYLDKLFRRLRYSKKEKGFLVTETTNYYNMLFDDRDLAARVRDIRDRYSVEFKGVEASEISQSTELAPLEQRSLPASKENLNKAHIVAVGLLGIPDEKQTQEERSLCLGITRAGGIDGGGERFLLNQYHAVTAEERARYQRQAILSAVMTVIDYYSIVFALEAPIEMMAESAAAGASVEELTSFEARSLELTGERELAARAPAMTRELETNIATRGHSLETQGEDVVPVEGTQNPEATGQGAHPEWEARKRSKNVTEKTQTQTPIQELGHDKQRGMSKKVRERGVSPAPEEEGTLPVRRKITKEEQQFGIPTRESWKEQIRLKTPTEAQSQWAQERLPVGSQDPAIEGAIVEGPAQADHLNPVSQVRKYEGFAALDEEGQLEVLNLQENLEPMSPKANNLKGGRTPTQWFKSKSGKNVPEAYKKYLMAREEEARVAIKKKIDEVLKKQMERNWGTRLSR